MRLRCESLSRYFGAPFKNKNFYYQVLTDADIHQFFLCISVKSVRAGIAGET